MTRIKTDDQDKNTQGTSTSWRNTRVSRPTWIASILAAALVLVVGSVAGGKAFQADVETHPVPQAAMVEAGLLATTVKFDLPAALDGGASDAAVVAVAPKARSIARSRSQTAPTPPVGPGDEVLELTPVPRAVGWVRSNDSRNNHLGDSFLYTGISNAELFHGVVQFDLSEVPRGAPIGSATLILTGLDDGRLDRDREGAWQAHWLAPAINEGWSRNGFQEIHNAAIAQTVLPVVSQSDLAPGVANRFGFNQDQLRLLEQALIDQQFQIAFRLDGPEAGSDNLFAWDSGFGAASSGNAPVLQLIVGTPPPTPPVTPTRDYIVVTSTPTPANVLTAAAVVLAATAQAQATGTATPTPPNMVTATPLPENEATAAVQGGPWVVTSTPTPANQATAAADAAYATAQAVTTGTWTPTPTWYVTATPSPTFVVITNTPTPNNARALLAWAVAQATRIAQDGPPTPIPPGFVTATPPWIVVTSTPTPGNAATAEAMRIAVTVAALTTGTFTPGPRFITATPAATPTALPLIQALQPTPTRTTAPDVIPDILKGKIVFRSDRLGGEQLFVMDQECALRVGGCPDAEVSLLRDSYPYDLALQQEPVSPDGRSRALVQIDGTGVPRLMVQGAGQNAVRRLYQGEGTAYDPVWSPLGDRIAFVSTEPDNDEIYTINPDGSNLLRLTNNDWEWDKHPTWSPDGNRILFYSNRDSGRRQLWIMNADGSGQRNISANQYNDWDPVWIK